MTGRAINSKNTSQRSDAGPADDLGRNEAGPAPEPPRKGVVTMHGNHAGASIDSDRADSATPDISADNGLIREGKNTKRSRCLTCRALVPADALDPAGQCDSCTVQRGLFPVKPWRRRKVVGGGFRSGSGNGYDPKTGRWGGRRG